jgi:hypothetical protein
MTETRYGCFESPNYGSSRGSKHGKFPEIKKNGFVATFHSSSKCDDEKNSISFVTAGYCIDFPSLSQMSHFNEELLQAENLRFQGKNCTGRVVEKEVFPLGCHRRLTSYILIERL